MMPLFPLSESDAKLVQEFISLTKRVRVNQPLRSQPNKTPHSTSEIYIAQAPAGGIAALVEVPGTSTSSADRDTVSSGVCNIYKIVHDKLFPITGLARKVYNVSPDAVVANSWMLIKKTKYGTWVTDKPCE